MENIENQMIVGSYYEGEVEIKPVDTFEMLWSLMEYGNEDVVDRLLKGADDFQNLYNSAKEFGIKISEEQKRTIGERLIDKHYEALASYLENDN